MKADYICVHQYPEPTLSYDLSIAAQIMIGFMLIAIARELFWPRVEAWVESFDGRTALERCGGVE